MGRCSLLLFAILLSALLANAAEDIQKLDPNMAAPGAEDGLLWYDAASLTLEGKGWTDTAAYYDRFPARAKEQVRESVWNLSTDSAGMAFHFYCDAASIAARWSVRDNTLAMPHMPATGVSGLDLYVNDNGTWRWIGAGRPDAEPPTFTKTLASGIPEGMHEFLLYLPLYNGVTSVEVGIAPEATLAPAPPRDGLVCLYGTSILQGGCASRPGMAYPAILGRRLNRPVINLGFSGNGELEPPVGALMAELPAAAYVLDCAPNLSADEITERLEPFVEALRAAKPDTPIVIVENVPYQAGAFLPGTRASYQQKNEATKAAYERLLAKQIGGLYYVPADNLFGSDGEATVDGTHATDLGFLRMAETIAPVLRQALNIAPPAEEHATGETQ